MASAGARLLETCELLCDELRRVAGLSVFRLELQRRRTVPLVITLSRSDPLDDDPGHEWMRPAVPATLERPLLRADRQIGRLRIEDRRRAEYPAEASAAVEDVLPRYATSIGDLLDEAQL